MNFALAILYLSTIYTAMRNFINNQCFQLFQLLLYDVWINGDVYTKYIRQRGIYKITYILILYFLEVVRVNMWFEFTKRRCVEINQFIWRWFLCLAVGCVQQYSNLHRMLHDLAWLSRLQCGGGQNFIGYYRWLPKKGGTWFWPNSKIMNINTRW